MRRALSIPINEEDILIDKITTWQAAQVTLIHAAGYQQSLWVDNSSFGGGYTFIHPTLAFRQHGIVKRLVIRMNDGGGAAKFKVFRWNAGTALYDLVIESAITIPVVGGVHTETIDLTDVITVQPGDVPGFWSEAAAVFSSDNDTKTLCFEAGDITSSNAFATTAARTLQVECLMYAPYLVITGDSVPEGHNTASNNHGGLHDAAGSVTLPWFIPAAEISAQIRALISTGTLLKYQNLSLGSQTYNWVATTGIVQAHAVIPHTVMILAGVNDINTARAWANVNADLNTIKAAITTEELLISEILPWTLGSDAQAALIRTWNANLAVWCMANGAKLMLCHDAMAQTRITTGELDNLKAAYDQDGIHLTAAGVLALAAIWKRYL